MAPKSLFKRITQIGLVVRNVDLAARRCFEEFGIGPWSFYTFDASTVKDMMIRGKRVDHAMRIASTTIGDVEWELIEPLDDKSIYAEHLRTHGEGLHHVMFDVENYAEARKQLGEKGCEEIVSGQWFGCPYSYLDTQASLGCLAEIWSPPAPGTPLPAPERTYP